MPKLFLTTPGHVRYLGWPACGEVSDTRALEVSEDVAREFEGQAGYRVEREEPAPRLGRRAKTAAEPAEKE